MDERKTHIDEFFRRQMGNHTETPPPAIWEALEKRLDTPPGRKKPFPVWWFYTIAGVILLSATAIIAGYLNNNQAIIAQRTPVSAVATISTAPSPAQEEAKTEGVQQITPAKSLPQETSAQQSTYQPQDNNEKKNNEAVVIQTPKRDAEHLVLVRQNNIQPLYQNNTSTLHNDLSKVLLPALPKQKDEIGVLTPQLPADNIAVATMIPAPKQPVSLPVVQATNLREDEELSTLSTTITKVNSIPAAELLASVNPMGTAYAIAQRETENIPGPNNTMATEEEVVPKAAVQQSHVDTTKKKRDLLKETDTSILEQTVYPVITKKKKPLPIEVGIKAGYSKGFDNIWRADKIAFAPYVEYRLPSGFSISIQPTYHTGKAKTGTFANGEQTFHQVTGSSFDSTGRVVRGKVDSSIITPNPPDTVFRTYTYGQAYDSIQISYGVTQTQLWDVELPLILKYKINKNFSVLAGGSVTYSSVLQTKEEVTTYKKSHQFVENITPATYYVTTQGQPPPDGPPRKSNNDLFPHSTESFTSFQPRQVAATNNFFRYGFMVGASATFKERWMIDVMLHKTGVDANAVPDKELRKIYSQPYLRVMVGYKLLK